MEDNMWLIDMILSDINNQMDDMWSTDMISSDVNNKLEDNM